MQEEEKQYHPTLKEKEKSYLNKRQIEFEKVPSASVNRLSFHAYLRDINLHFSSLLTDLHVAKNKYNEFSAEPNK